MLMDSFDSNYNNNNQNNDRQQQSKTDNNRQIATRASGKSLALGFWCNVSNVATSILRNSAMHCLLFLAQDKLGTV